MTAFPTRTAETTAPPAVTIAVPSLNQGTYVGKTLGSIFAQAMPVAVNLMDAGSTDDTLDAVAPFKPRLNRFRSHPDGGQAAAINEGLDDATTPFVAWLNADDEYLPAGLRTLTDALERSPDAPFAYGQTRLENGSGAVLGSYATEPWSRDRFARKCFVSQPATLIRTSAWRKVGGLNSSLHMALDYDLWWRLAASSESEPVFVDRPVALARLHPDAKTMSRPVDHYREAMAVVRHHYGRVPWWWWLKMPASIGARCLLGRVVGIRRFDPGR